MPTLVIFLAYFKFVHRADRIELLVSYYTVTPVNSIKYSWRQAV